MTEATHAHTNCITKFSTKEKGSLERHTSEQVAHWYIFFHLSFQKSSVQSYFKKPDTEPYIRCSVRWTWWYFCPWEMVLIKFYPDSHLILISNFPMPQEQEQDSSLRFLEGILAKLLINEAQILCLKPSLPTPSALKERLAYYWEVLCLDWASINFFSVEYCQVCSIFLAASSVLSPYWDQGNGQAEHVAASCSG